MVAYYQGHCLNKTSVYDGLMEVIGQMVKQGVRIAVLTNKNQLPTDLIVDHYFGAGTFAPVIGVSEGVKVKPDPTSVLKIIDDWGLSRDEVVYVGDSDVDIETAENAGIRCLACLWGFRSKEQLIAAGARILIERPEEILDYLH
jgi:phosphoglycolate phosphatase